MNTSSKEFKMETSQSLKTPEITPDFVPMIRIIFWNSMGFFFFSFLIPYVTVQLLKASGLILGFAFTMQTIGGLISSPLVGYLTDKYSKKKLVLIGSFGRAACYISMYLGIIFSSLLIFILGMFILGFFVGFFWTPLDTLISEKSNKTNRSYAFGKRASMIGLGNLCGSVIAFSIFWLGNTFWPEDLFIVYSPLLLFALSNIFGGIIFSLKVNEKLTYEKHVFNLFPDNVESIIAVKKPIVNDVKSKTIKTLKRGFFLSFLILIIAIMISSMNGSIAYPFYQVYLINNLKVTDPTMVMLIYFPSQVVALLFAPKLGKISDKINPIIGISIVGSLGAFVTWLIINTNSGIVFGIILIADSTFAWTGNLILQNVLSRISKVHRGKIFGAAQWLSMLGSIAGPLIGGFAWDNVGHTAPFIISIFIELSIIPLYIIAIELLKPYMAEKID